MSETTPLVGIVMGSDSDWDVMRDAEQVCKDFQVPCECRVLSAHRTPQDMLRYAETAQERGLHALVAGAGGAAHLPGMLASATTLPVIGVPISSPHLQGWDSLLSIAQMPGGVPVATMAINGARNAGLLAMRVLALRDETLSERLRQYQQDLAAQSRAKKLT